MKKVDSTEGFSKDKKIDKLKVKGCPNLFQKLTTTLGSRLCLLREKVLLDLLLKRKKRLNLNSRYLEGWGRDISGKVQVPEIEIDTSRLRVIGMWRSRRERHDGRPR